ncbi:LysE family translocator [Streptosporangium sp. NBC_01639]|uniref:LysE family translocator n=1 Tax=Streptosporangium sp. NBC_01639 TaxID=2975948 RepID=UPI0038658AD9|nr:LysE family translocator [Streptosporangium sp. NBC_01639]
MVSLYPVAAFLVAVFPLIATPGASLALLTRQVTREGRRRAVPVILGTVTGLYVHAGLAVAGLSALIMHSSLAFTVVKLAGAAYLIGLAGWTWRSSTPRAPAVPRRHLPTTAGSPYVQALLGNVLNPKAASIYLTLIPQFIAPHRPVTGQILTFATAHALLITGWLLVWTGLIGGAERMLSTPRFKTAVTRITAVTLLALGIRSAVA